VYSANLALLFTSRVSSFILGVIMRVQTQVKNTKSRTVTGVYRSTLAGLVKLQQEFDIACELHEQKRRTVLERNTLIASIWH
jgi:hypothetical protein